MTWVWGEYINYVGGWSIVVCCAYVHSKFVNGDVVSSMLRGKSAGLPPRGPRFFPVVVRRSNASVINMGIKIGG